MKRGLDRSAAKRVAVLLAVLVASAQACGEDKPANAAQGGSGDGGEGGGAGDASIEDASGGDSAIDEGGGAGGAGGEAGSGGDSGEGGSSGAGAGGESGNGGTSGEGGESGDGGEGPQADAGPQGDAGPQDAVCFQGGDEIESSASGACDAPIIIDMSELGFGATVFHRTGTATTSGLVPNIDKCGEGTGRDVVFNVKTPGTADLEVSVDAADGSDPSIVVQEGPDTECDKSAATLCVDDTAAGECEYLRISVASGGYEENTPQIVIGEIAPSGVALEVRFRLIDPGGGS
jgi:hypothetical protein